MEFPVVLLRLDHNLKTFSTNQIQGNLNIMVQFLKAITENLIIFSDVEVYLWPPYSKISNDQYQYTVMQFRGLMIFDHGKLNVLQWFSIFLLFFFIYIYIYIYACIFFNLKTKQNHNININTIKLKLNCI